MYDITTEELFKIIDREAGKAIANIKNELFTKYNSWYDWDRAKEGSATETFTYKGVTTTIYVRKAEEGSWKIDHENEISKIGDSRFTAIELPKGLETVKTIIKERIDESIMRNETYTK
jgi:hypothetical protein